MGGGGREPAWLRSCGGGTLEPSDLDDCANVDEVALVASSCNSSLDEVIPVHRYTSLEKAMRVTGWALRFIHSH